MLSVVAVCEVTDILSAEFITVHNVSGIPFFEASCVNKELIVEETDFATLRALHLNDKYGDATRADTLIPTLKEYIATCKRYEKIAVLELKNEFTKDEIDAICNEIKELDYLDSVIFISFCFYPILCLQ